MSNEPEQNLTLKRGNKGVNKSRTQRMNKITRETN